MNMQSNGETCNEAKSPLNHLTLYTSSRPVSSATASTHSNVYTADRTQTVGKAPVTQVPSSRSALPSNSTIYDTPCNASNVIQPISYTPVNNTNYMEHHFSEVPSQPSYNTADKTRSKVQYVV